MITKFGKQVHLQDVAQMDFIKSKSLVKLKTCLDYQTRVPMATKLGRMVTYLGKLLPIKSHDPLIM